jgi:hypothetical protein
MQQPYTMLTREEATNLVLLILFILPFIIVLRQLFIAEALEMPRPQEKEKK